MPKKLFVNDYSGLDGSKPKRTVKSFADKFPNSMRKL